MRVASRRWNGILIGALSAVGLGFAAPANGQALFTTVSDFSGWSASGNATAVAASTAYDFDGSTANGLGNTTAYPGTSSIGSLQVTASTLSYSYLAFSPQESTNAAFLSAIDPGSTPVTYPGPTYSQVPGATTAYSGTLYFVYTVPSFSALNYYQFGLDLSYNGDSYYNPQFANGVSDGTVDGLSTYTVTIPYTIVAGSMTGFSIGIVDNASATASSPFYFDDISLSPPVPAPVPEPATLGVLGTGFAMLTLRRRRA
jgi:PEP-CTERM motif-containing protein